MGRSLGAPLNRPPSWSAKADHPRVFLSRLRNNKTTFVMPGLVPGIHVHPPAHPLPAHAAMPQDVDARNKSGHDGRWLRERPAPTRTGGRGADWTPEQVRGDIGGAAGSLRHGLPALPISSHAPYVVMPGLDPGIHVDPPARPLPAHAAMPQDVDARIKSGHDGRWLPELPSPVVTTRRGSGR